MKIYSLLLIAAALSCAPLTSAEAGTALRLSPRFRTVYVLEMANGLDQHLANHLTATRAMWVVLEPATADAVLTESLDDSFWSWLSRTYPPAPSAQGAPAAQPGSREPTSGRGPNANPRHPGMVFLVDPRTRVVLWSAWDMPKNPSAPELEHAAQRIATQLKAAFDKK